MRGPPPSTLRSCDSTAQLTPTTGSASRAASRCGSWPRSWPRVGVVIVFVLSAAIFKGGGSGLTVPCRETEGRAEAFPYTKASLLLYTEFRRARFTALHTQKPVLQLHVANME